jgi:hypothetical protein
MDALSTETRAIVTNLIRDHTLWIAILSVLYLFSLYVYFFPTPLSVFYETFHNSSDSHNFVT